MGNRIGICFGPSNAQVPSERMRTFLPENNEFKGRLDQYIEYAEKAPENNTPRIPLLPNLARNSLVISAIHAGIFEILRTNGVEPHVIGGISVGALSAASAAGVITNETHARLAIVRDERDGDGTSTTATVLVAEEDLPKYEHEPDVFISVDFGPIRNVGQHLLLLSGRVTALHDLAQRSTDLVDVHDPSQSDGARHAPGREIARAAAERMLDADMSEGTPTWPVASSVSPMILRTTADVRQDLLANQTNRLTFKNLLAAYEREGCTEIITIGPGTAGLDTKGLQHVAVEDPSSIPNALDVLVP